MGKDYYKILGVKRDASDKEIKKAYRRLAQLTHPDKQNTEEEKKAANAKFAEISEAYEVLSDKRKRAIFDQVGEEGLKGFGNESSDASGMGGMPGVRSFTFHMGGNGMPGGFSGFRASDPMSVFSQFFSTNGGFDFSRFAAGDEEDNYDENNNSDRGDYKDFKDSKSYGSATRFARSGGMPTFSHGIHSMRNTRPPKKKATEHQLSLSLEDLYNGRVKKLRITRTIFGNAGNSGNTEATPREEQKEIKIDIKPGWKKGTRITFEGAGDQQAPNILPDDLIFVIDEKPHERFIRENDNLIYKCSIPLVDALTGCTISVNALDDRKISYDCKEVIKPGDEKVIVGEGMPILGIKETEGGEGKKGNLIIKFDVVFPRLVSADQKKKLREMKLN